jgi:hypothetical protein
MSSAPAARSLADVGNRQTVSTLAGLARGPSRVDDLDVDHVAAFLAQIEAVATRLAARLAIEARAAAASDLPFAVRLGGGAVRFSYARIAKWRMARGDPVMSTIISWPPEPDRTSAGAPMKTPTPKVAKSQSLTVQPALTKLHALQDDVRRVTQLVARGDYESALICGPGGLGKSHVVGDATIPGVTLTDLKTPRDSPLGASLHEHLLGEEVTPSVVLKLSDQGLGREHERKLHEGVDEQPVGWRQEISPPVTAEWHDQRGALNLVL